MFSGYTGIVYPVNPKAKSILGVRAYASILEIPDDVDLAVIIVPAVAVARAIEEAGAKGCKGIIVISAGFKEIGGEGIERERQLKATAEKYGMAVIGPNCFGVMNTDPTISLNATFSRLFPLNGKIAFVSQSGAVGSGALEYAQAEKIGFSKFVSMGNKTDINENHLLAALGEDPTTDVILMYVEDLEDPKEFLELAWQISERKPILAVKSGRTQEGAKAAASHTGALAGSDEVYDSLFAQCGVLRVETLEELFDYGIAFVNQPLPKGPHVAIVTNAGGPGIMATDACIRHGLELAKLNPKTKEKMRPHMPQAVSLENPVDLIGDALEDRYELSLQAVLADESVDAVMVMCVPQMVTNLEAMAKVFAKQAQTFGKPVFAVFMATGNIEPALKVLEEAKIPHYRFPEDAARAMAAMARYVLWRRRPRTEVKQFEDVRPAKVREILNSAKRQGRRFLPEPEAHEVLHAYGFPTLHSALARDEAEAVRAAQEIGFPVVMKIVSPQVLHKVDVGGVKLNLQSEAEVQAAYRDLIQKIRTARGPDLDIWGVLVQEMVKGGKETILGMKRDPHFGPLLMFGLGGIYVEVFKDVTFRIAPIRQLSARRMIEQVKGSKILKGFRGEPPSDIHAIEECLERLSQLVLDFPEIEEMDINPLIVLSKGARVVDARILIND